MSQPARQVVETRATGNVVQADASSLMDVISRAASDASIDVDKLERLMGLYERITARQAETAYDEAMNAAQAEMAPIRADASNPQTKSRYASFVALDRALRPIYAKHGFSLSYDTADGAPEGHVRVVCHVSHVSGDKRHPHVDMPADGKGAKGGEVMTRTHATGAALTYGQRYLLKMIFNIAVGDDNDGNAPRGERKLSEVAKRAIEEINGAEDSAALVLWKKNKSEGVAKMATPAELQEIVGLFNRRVEHFKAEAEHAG